MPRLRILIVTTLLCTSVFAFTTAAAAQDKSADKKLYCWNENGRKVCGDTLPPEAVNRARTEINPNSGMRSGQIGRSLTEVERTAAAAQARLDADAASAEATRRRRDMAMAESYAAESDLRRAFGERIALVDEGLKISRLGVINLRQSLLSLLRRAGELELQGKPVAKPLADSIHSQHADLSQQQMILAKQLRERTSLDQDLAEALARYRAMKQPQAAADNVTPEG